MLEVVKLTLAPMFAPVEKLPVPIVRIVEFTIALPIVRSDGVRLAVDVELDAFTNPELTTTFEIEFTT